MTKSLMISLVLFASAFVLSSFVIAEDAQYLEKLKSDAQSQLARETKPYEIEKLKKHIAKLEESLRELKLTPEEIIAETEAKQCPPKDDFCDLTRSQKISRLKRKVAAENNERERQRIDKEQMQKIREAQDAERDGQEKKDRIEDEAREKVFKEQERLEQEQKDNEEAAYDKAMSDYIASKMKEFAQDKTLVTIKPGSKLCVFPDSGGGYLFVEDVDKNKVHAITEYGHPLRPTHKVVGRKHPKFDGKMELEFIVHGLGMFQIEDLKRVRVAAERCRF